MSYAPKPLVLPTTKNSAKCPKPFGSYIYVVPSSGVSTGSSTASQCVAAPTKLSH